MTIPPDDSPRPTPPPPLHLLKMAVGAADLEDLRRARAARMQQLGGSWVYTRNHPRRVDEVLIGGEGGSLFWVIRGQVRARQRIVGFDSARDDKGRAYCLIGVDPELVPTTARPWRPFQGWRYLSAADAPPDLAGLGGSSVGPDCAADAAIPARLVAELRALGLW